MAGGRTDTDILEGLLFTEHRLISAYEAALRRDAIDPQLAAELLAQEREHVRALLKTLGGGADRNPRASVPSPDLTAALRSRDAFARFALDMETEAVRVYAEAATNIHDPKLRQPLGSIMACEAAHGVALRDALGERPLVDYSG
jgi:rubrerythrin